MKIFWRCPYCLQRSLISKWNDINPSWDNGCAFECPKCKKTVKNNIGEWEKWLAMR